MPEDLSCDFPDLEITDQDVTEAMEEIPGYLDITPGDFRTLYQVALRHACRRMRHSLRAKDLMATRVVVVHPETPLAEVAERMAQANVSGVPVVDAQARPVGMVSEVDFLTRMGETAGAGLMGVVAKCLHGKGCLAVPIRGRTAADIMASPAVTIREEATVLEVAERLTRSGVNRLPVLSDGGAMVGIVSRTDLVRAHLA